VLILNSRKQHCASLLRPILASLAYTHKWVRVQNVRDFPQTKFDSEINAPFLEHHFLFHNLNLPPGQRLHLGKWQCLPMLSSAPCVYLACFCANFTRKLRRVFQKLWLWVTIRQIEVINLSPFVKCAESYSAELQNYVLLFWMNS